MRVCSRDCLGGVPHWPWKQRASAHAKDEGLAVWSLPERFRFALTWLAKWSTGDRPESTSGLGPTRTGQLKRNAILCPEEGGRAAEAVQSQAAKACLARWWAEGGSQPRKMNHELSAVTERSAATQEDSITDHPT